MSTSKNTIHLSDGAFARHIEQGKGLALVDFWAEWCGPCRALGPVIDGIADKYAGKVSVYKMDIDANPRTPQAFQIRGVPTVLVFKDGQLVERLVGARPESDFVSALEKHLRG